VTVPDGAETVISSGVVVDIDEHHIGGVETVVARVSGSGRGDNHGPRNVVVVDQISSTQWR
jgi:hypothetical protein